MGAWGGVGFDLQRLASVPYVKVSLDANLSFGLSFEVLTHEK